LISDGMDQLKVSKKTNIKIRLKIMMIMIKVRSLPLSIVISASRIPIFNYWVMIRINSVRNIYF